MSEKNKAKRKALGLPLNTTFTASKKGLKQNPEKQAKAAKRQRAKHAAYMKSETRKAVQQRSGFRCEAGVRIAPPFPLVVKEPVWLDGDWSVSYSDDSESWTRCRSGATVHHHRTYARYGGNELPEDMLHVCKRCHDAIESQKGAGNRFTRSRR